MWFWARAGAGATCIYTGERWLAGMMFESVPENVWLGIAASSLLFIVVGDSARWLNKRRREKEKAKREEEKEKAKKDAAERQGIRQLLRDVKSETVAIRSIESAI